MGSVIYSVVTQDKLHFGEPIVLIGRPKRLSGFLSVHNPQNIPVKLKRLQLKTPRELTNSCDPETLQVRMAGRICPGETALFPIALSLPPGTPPGVYEARLEASEARACSVKLEVLAHQGLEFVPASGGYAGQPGCSVDVRTHVRNTGNVPLTIPKRMPIEFHAGGRGLPYHFHSAARSHGAEGYDAFLNAFTKGMSRDEAPIGRVKLTEGAGELAPQAARLIEMTVSLPKKLRSDRRYLAIVRLGQAMLSLTLFMSAAPQPIPSPPR